MPLYSVDKDGKKTLQHQTKPAEPKQAATANESATKKSKAATTQNSKKEQ